MRRSLVLALSLAFAALPASAQESRGHLTMTGSATVAAEPDITRAHGSVSVEGDSAEETLGMAKERMASLRRSMEPFGTVRGSRISLQQNHSKSKSLIGSGDPGFSARGSITVTLSDPEKAGAALDALVKAGIDGIARLDYDISDRATLMVEARERAVADAVMRARTYARAAELDLGPIIDLSENHADSTGGAYHGPDGHDTRYYGAQGMAGAGPLAPPGVAAIVTIRWALE